MVPEIKKPGHATRPFANSFGCGGGIRTRDLWVMSPTSYRTAPPRVTGRTANVSISFRHSQGGRSIPINTLPIFADVESAARQIAGAAHRTPVATSRTVKARTGADVFFKGENAQRPGDFNFRGAYNALSRLAADERRRGVITFSSGNHAQAIALAGQVLDIPRVIVMPSDAPAVKRSASEGYGGEVILYDRDKEDREAIGRRLATERGLTLIPPYEHPH